MASVVGYHGTSTSAAAHILTKGFLPSTNRFDWLGDGAYFFQEAPDRAKAWAIQTHGEADAAVVHALISLDDCMDLLDPAWFSVLTRAHDAVVEQHRRAGLRLPKQEGLAHGMDRLVINYAVRILDSEGLPIRSVRGVFAEGRPAFPGSALLDLAHVQIAVRDLEVISRVEVLGGDPA